MKLVFAHKYRWSHRDRRKQMRRAHWEGRVKIVSTFQDGWLYSVPNDFKPKKTR